MRLTGYDTRGTADTSDDRGRYSLLTPLPDRERAQIGSSRWRIQVGAKYIW